MHVPWGIGEGVFVLGSVDLGFSESDSRMLLLDLSFDEGTGGQHVDEGRGALDSGFAGDCATWTRIGPDGLYFLWLPPVGWMALYLSWPKALDGPE